MCICSILFIHLIILFHSFIHVYSSLYLFILIDLCVINDFVCYRYELYDQDCVHMNLRRDMGTH